MLSRFATAVHSAVDALAPPVPLQEEFVFHWRAVINFFLDTHSDSKAPIEETNIPAHLRQMMQILVDEEEITEIGSTGPCLEYFLHHKLLDTLHALGRADCPPGMKQYILLFFSQLLTKIKQPILPHVSVHRPVQRMIKMCGEVKATPTEMEEIQFLCIICAKLREAPHLVSFFVENYRKPITTRSANTSESDSTVKEGDPIDSIEVDGATNDSVTDHNDCSTSLNVEYPLVTSLLTLCQSADSMVAVKACEGLLLCTSLPDEHGAQCIIEQTQFCHVLTERLINLYGCLPKAGLDPTDIDLVKAKWGLDVFNFSEDELMFPGKRQLVTFLSWLDYCDQLIKESQAVVGHSLAEAIRKRFFEEVMQPNLLDKSENRALVTTAYITKCLQQTSSQPLLKEWAVFLLGEERQPELLPGVIPHPLKRELIERCSSSTTTESNELCMPTLKLFEALIEQSTEHALHNLVLANVSTRDYVDQTLVDCHDSWSDEEDERMRRGAYDADISPGSSPVSRTLAPSNIHKIINRLLMLLPDELKSSDNEEDTGYEIYLRDAHLQFRECAMSCSSFDWPREAVSLRDDEQTTAVLSTSSAAEDDRSSSESPAEADSDSAMAHPRSTSLSSFYEGSFLHMLFDNLETLLEQPYEVNLQLTSIISKLAMLPHPYLHEFLLNPLIPLVSSARTLCTVLEKVVVEIQIKILDVPNYKRRLLMTRRQLLCENEDDDQVPNTNRSSTIAPGDGFLEAVIVFEEFCKELAAIAFVKYHASS